MLTIGGDLWSGAWRRWRKEKVSLFFPEHLLAPQHWTSLPVILWKQMLLAPDLDSSGNPCEAEGHEDDQCVGVFVLILIPLRSNSTCVQEKGAAAVFRRPEPFGKWKLSFYVLERSHHCERPAVCEWPDLLSCCCETQLETRGSVEITWRGRSQRDLNGVAFSAGIQETVLNQLYNLKNFLFALGGDFKLTEVIRDSSSCP